MQLGHTSRLLVPFAMLNERLVHISEVESGKQINCLCPGCREPLIAKKGRVVQHHFAHEQETVCNPESVMYLCGRLLIHDGLKRAIVERRPLPAKWSCELCGDEHSGNLLKKAARVELEEGLGFTNPDVMLLGAAHEPIAAIKVVEIDGIDAAVRQFYREKNIALLLVRVESTTQLEALRNLQALIATSGSVCVRRKCPDCRRPLMPSPIHIVIGNCYRCRKPMKIGFKWTREGMVSPDDFSDQDIRRAREGSCILKVRWSDTAQARYLANNCLHCGTFIGRHYLYEYCDPVAIVARQKDEIYCSHCDRHFD